ncbi:MAG: dicarboxylate/amino acid:cation symporter [Lachnospiraceae bacterium]|nr:dicarboxylate/amino acid:cation symporter [Lachnospiraceae bacterium]
MKQKKKISITTLIFIGLVLGVILGLVAPGRADFLLDITDLFGTVYMNALRMMIYPMVYCSIVAGICSAGSISATGKISGRAIGYFVFTTAAASLIGLVIPRFISLGKGVSFEMVNSDIAATEFTSILDTVKNLIPSNPVASFAEGNMLQVLIFAMITGFAAIAIGEKAKPFLDFINSFNEICLKVITVVMHFTPFGVFCTIAPVIAANGIGTILSLAQALIALYIAFYVFAFIVYGGTAKIYGKMSPFKFFGAIMPAALNAFGTCSSSATIPLSKQCAEENLDIDPSVSSIVLPMGATINMDAVSILMSFMITFFANACGIEISIGLMVVILLSNCLLSIGTPGVPGGAIASFAALAAIAGLPAGVMGVYISINTLCDMGATCVNVLGDLAATVYVQKSVEK